MSIITIFEALEEKYCTVCGCDLLAEGEALEHDGEMYCESCFHDEFALCEHCDEYFPRHEAEFVDRYDIWCPDCVADYADYCDRCGRYTSGDLYETYDGSMVCENCARNYRTCSDCSTLINDDDVRYDADHDVYCPECFKKVLIGAWHSHKSDFKFFGSGYPFIGLGFELEVDNDYDIDRYDSVYELVSILDDHCYYETDGSLDYGFEIITNPHTLEEFNKLPIEDVCKSLKNMGWLSHDYHTCGLHVHVSRTAFGETFAERKENIAKMMFMYLNNYDQIIKIARRGDVSCSHALEHEVLWFAHVPCVSDLTHEDVKRFINAEVTDRYYHINLENPATVEYRQGKGTLRPDSLRAWCEFCYLISINSKNVDIEDVNLNHWLVGASDNLKSYMRERHVVLD